MQIVGQNCQSCGVRITTVTEGNGCPACSHVWHRDCSPEPEICPSCHQDVQEAHRAISRKREDSFSRQIGRGRLIYWIMLSAAAASQLPGVVSLINGGQYGFAFQGFVSFAGYFAVWITAFLGSLRARYYLGAAAFLNLFLSVGLFRFSPIGFSLAITADLFSIWVCVFSNCARMFEGRFRARKPDPAS